jgi:hypothetical protein
MAAFQTLLSPGGQQQAATYRQIFPRFPELQGPAERSG